jgi:hypothetical protein
MTVRPRRFRVGLFLKYMYSPETEVLLTSVGMKFRTSMRYWFTTAVAKCAVVV